ncbi:MAG: DUF106 domain-containing protein [Euryarchaeota archaeon]|nr:DUF106 domain-containing protein [Euryarchaeota archaeon]
MVQSTIYQPLDPVFGVFFHLTGNDQFNAMFGVFVMALLLSTLINVVTSRVIDQKEMKRLKEELAGYQKRMKEAQKKGDMKRFNELQKQMMEKQSTMMTKSFKPMMYTFLPIVVILGWLRNYDFLQSYIAAQGYLVMLPFSLPKFGNTLNWLGWYIMCSFALSTLTKKLMNINM